ARMGGGDVRFGGRIAFEGYSLGEMNVTVRGDGVQMRYPEGVRSVVDADLSVRGSLKAPTLGGIVTVKNAVYSKPLDAPETLLDFAIRRSAGGANSSADVSTTATPATIPLRFDVQ